MKSELGWGASIALVANGFLGAIQLIKIETVLTAAAVALVSGLIAPIAQSVSKYIIVKIKQFINI
jgi:hypothetical protein